MPSTPRKKSSEPEPKAQIATSMPASPGAAMQEEIPYSPDSTQEGAVYVYRGGIGFVSKVVDADVVLEVLRNHLVRKNKLKLKRLIFRDRYKLKVLDPKGEPDDELAKHVTQMLDAPAVNLWSKMMIAWSDIMDWGPSLYNPVWEKRGSEWILAALRHLPSESFSVPAPNAVHEYSELLPGIVLDENTGEVQFWQSLDMISSPKQLKNVFMLKDPTCSQVAGESQIETIVGLVREYNFCRKAQMQQVNRIGASNVFIKFTSRPSAGDLKWAGDILDHWGNNTAFMLKPNMGIEGINITETKVAIVTVEDVRKEIDDFFSPSSMIKKQEGSLGSTGNAENDQTDAFIQGWHAILEDGFRPLAQMYLDLNGYDGYQVFIDIPPPQKDRSQIKMDQAKAAHECGVALINEKRELLGLPPLDDEGFAKLEEERRARTPPQLQQPAKGEDDEDIKNKADPADQADPLEEDIGNHYDNLASRLYEGLQQLDRTRGKA